MIFSTQYLVSFKSVSILATIFSVSQCISGVFAVGLYTDFSSFLYSQYGLLKLKQYALFLVKNMNSLRLERWLA